MSIDPASLVLGLGIGFLISTFIVHTVIGDLKALEKRIATLEASLERRRKI